MRILWIFVPVLAVCIGCSSQKQAANTDENSSNNPEAVYRQFFLSSLTPNEAEIRSLIIERPDAETLWSGKYPEKVADLLREQYRTMEIKRVESAGDKDPNKIVLESSALPIQVTVVRVEGKWKLDAGPIIELRKAANSFRGATKNSE
jgi:hypothetical protein